MEHLFKLKKDGKYVGKLRIKNGEVWWKYAEYSKVVNSCWYSVRTGKAIVFDTAHPFVTKDKHGKDVFANDKVISSDGLRKYKVIWDERRCRWWLCGIEKPWAVNEPVWENYELIEDKDA